MAPQRQMLEISRSIAGGDFFFSTNVNFFSLYHPLTWGKHVFVYASNMWFVVLDALALFSSPPSPTWRQPLWSNLVICTSACSHCRSNTSFPLHEPRRMCPTSWSEVRAAFTWGLMSQYWLRRGILHRPTHTLQANNHTKAVWCCENNNNNNINNTPICPLSFILIQICVLIKTGLWHFSICAHLFLLGFLTGGP